MFSFLFNERRRRSLVPLAALALTAGYLFVLMPLGQRADKLKEPLDKAWLKLSAALGQTNNPTIDFVGITNQLEATRQAIAAVETTRKKAAARADLGEAVRDRMNAPFQLVDYENERGKQQDDLRKLAAQHQVTVSPAVFDGYPAHTADVRQPSLLWAELALIEDVLTTAIRCKVTAIHSLSVPLALTNSPPPEGVRTLAEIPVQIEFTAAAPVVAQVLQSIPLRADEMKAAGLPEVATNKPALFIERLTLRKQSPEKPDEVRAAVRVVGFVFRE
jgi:hypothetical protein